MPFPRLPPLSFPCRNPSTGTWLPQGRWGQQFPCVLEIQNRTRHITDILPGGERSKCAAVGQSLCLSFPTVTPVPADTPHAAMHHFKMTTPIPPIPGFFLVPTLSFTFLSSSLSPCTQTQVSQCGSYQLQFNSCFDFFSSDGFPHTHSKPPGPFPPALNSPATSTLASKRPQKLSGYFLSPFIS